MIANKKVSHTFPFGPQQIYYTTLFAICKEETSEKLVICYNFCFFYKN